MVVRPSGRDEEGGGYPGTCLDVSAAADALLELGAALGLKVDRFVATGHSAGGHHAAWLANRPNLPQTSPLSTGACLPLTAVFISGGLADLAASEPVTRESCLVAIRDQLVGAPGTLAFDTQAELLLAYSQR